jgi:hypothetical protein
MSGIRVGSYVTHSLRPAWGVGKVFGQSQQHVLVGFSNLSEPERFKRLEWRPGLLERAVSVTSDPELDSWKVECDSTCHYIGAVAKPKRMTKTASWSREDAMERFIRKSELPRVRAAMMRTEKMTPFLIALADILEAPRPNAAQYAAYLTAFTALEFPPKKTPLTWPIVTALPFIAHPERHMVVKPSAMQTAASGLGFAIQYKATPNWATYDRVLQFSDEVLAFIKPRGGEDMIDVHAFISAIVER